MKKGHINHGQESYIATIHTTSPPSSSYAALILFCFDFASEAGFGPAGEKYCEPDSVEREYFGAGAI